MQKVLELCGLMGSGRLLILEGPWQASALFIFYLDLPIVLALVKDLLRVGLQVVHDHDLVVDYLSLVQALLLVLHVVVVKHLLNLLAILELLH